MPDTRKHRGPHPDDAELFSAAALPLLQQAVADLSWLLTRRYAVPSALKLVGDRYQLKERQRLAVLRSSCSDQALEHRRRTRVPLESLAGATVQVDGFNVLTTIEAALAGGVILRGRDDCDRDMASMHGSYRKVAETIPALTLIGETLHTAGVTQAVWLLDRPVSNSARLAQRMYELAAEHGWNWHIELVANPDPVLIASTEVVATADSAILDGCRRWINLAHEIIRQRIPTAYVLRLDGKLAAIIEEAGPIL